MKMPSELKIVMTKLIASSKGEGFVSTLIIVRGLFWLKGFPQLPMDKYTGLLYNYE